MIYAWINIPKEEKPTPWELPMPRILDPIVYPRFHLSLTALAILFALCVFPFVKLFELFTPVRGGDVHV